MNRLSQRLKEARTQSGLSQEKLAEAVGVSGHAVYLFERGKNRPALDTLERIAAATGKPLAWFFQDEDASAPAEPPAEPPAPQPDMPSLLAQLVAAQVQMAQAQARAEERQAEMSQALTALAHEQMQARAEAARTSARLTQVEEGLRALLETPTGGCGEGEETRAG